MMGGSGDPCADAYVLADDRCRAARGAVRTPDEPRRAHERAGRRATPRAGRPRTRPVLALWVGMPVLPATVRAPARNPDAQEGGRCTRPLPPKIVGTAPHGRAGYLA